MCKVKTGHIHIVKQNLEHIKRKRITIRQIPSHAVIRHCISLSFDDIRDASHIQPRWGCGLRSSDHSFPHGAGSTTAALGLALIRPLVPTVRDLQRRAHLSVRPCAAFIDNVQDLMAWWNKTKNNNSHLITDPQRDGLLGLRDRLGGGGLLFAHLSV